MENIQDAERRQVGHIGRLMNFRDIGGLRTKDGRRMKSGIIYRSDEPSHLSALEIEQLLQLHIKLICDLRTSIERKSKVMRLQDHQRVQIVNIPFSQNEQDYTHYEFFKMIMKEARRLDFDQVMRDFYYRIAFESTAQIREVMTLLADDANRPALIHCTGGKDRTGVLAAFIQLLAGVPRDEVVQDYLRSNLLIEARMKRAAHFMRMMSLFQLSKEQLQPMMEVRAYYLEQILDEIMDRYQSIEKYLLEGCGVSDISIKHLKGELVEEFE